MHKRIFLLVLVFAVLLLSACSSANKYGLAYTSDGGDDIDYIYYDDMRVVYVVGGLMMIDIDGEAKLLEMALKEGDITVEDILAVAEEDVGNEKITATDYPDGSRDYHYEGFNIIKLNTHLGNRDIYFVPSGMSYYDVNN